MRFGFLPYTYIILYRLFTFSGGTFLRGVQGNPNYFPILVQGDTVPHTGTPAPGRARVLILTVRRLRVTRVTISRGISISTRG